MEPRFNSLTDLARELATPANITRTSGIILLVPVISSVPWLTMSADLGGIIGLGLLGTTIVAITTGNPGFLYPAIGGLIGIGICIKIDTIRTYRQIDQMMNTNIAPLICNIKKKITADELIIFFGYCSIWVVIYIRRENRVPSIIIIGEPDNHFGVNYRIGFNITTTAFARCGIVNG